MKAIKALGQHFLSDQGIASDIADLGQISPGDRVWEVGPGPGMLTGEILARGARLEAFELDRRMAGILRERFGDSLDLKIIDILKLDWPQQLQKAGLPLKLIANIPYQITSPLLYRIEAHHSSFSRIVMMIQKEVAQRLSAEPGTKSFGPLTLRLGLRFEIETALMVKPESFDPVPKVDSAVIVMTPRKALPQIKDISLYFKIITAAFTHRRKTLKNNLIPMLGKEKMAQLELASKIDFGRRAETLSESEYILLSDLTCEL